MKLTSEQLKRIIAEEVNRVLSEAPYGRRGVGYDFRSPPGGAGNTGYRERGFGGDAPAQLVYDPMGTQPAPLPTPADVQGIPGEIYQLTEVVKLEEGCMLLLKKGQTTQEISLDKTECAKVTRQIIDTKSLGMRASKGIAETITGFLKNKLGQNAKLSGMCNFYQKFKDAGLI